MAGGFGTRLRPLTSYVPKPMVPLMNRPIIGHIVKLLKNHGFDDIIVLLFYQPEIIRKYLGDGSEFGVRIRYKLPEVDLGTAGSIKFAEDLIDDSFLVISGDLLTDVDLTKFTEFHREKKGDASILLTKVGNPLPFGIVMTEDDKITEFLEKPSWGEVFSDRINSGIYLFEKKLLDMMKENTEYDFGNDIFPKLLADSETKLLGFPAEGYWKDIGNLEEYLAVHMDCLSGKVISGFLTDFKDGLNAGSKVTMGDNITIAGNVLIDNKVVVEDGAYLENSVIGGKSRIKAGTRIINSVLWDNVIVGPNAQSKNAVISSRTKVGESSVISDKVYIGEEVTIGDRSLIKPQVKIWPKKTIASDMILSTSLVWGDRWLRDLFTDSRISGLANTEITPEFASRLGSALGAFFSKGSTVYSSRDHDNASYMVSNALQAGMNSTGVNIEDLALMPIPVVRQVLRGSNFQGGLHIRKSPYADKTLDIIALDSNGLDLHTNKCKKVERLFFGEDYARVDMEEVGTKDYKVKPVEIYREKFLSVIDSNAFSENPLKVVVDFSFGPGSTLFPTIFSEFDIEIIALNAFMTPKQRYFTDEKRLDQAKQLAQIVQSVGADIGLIIDQTCERLFVVDDRGRFFRNIDVLTLVTKLYLEMHTPESIGAPLNAPAIIRKMAEDNGHKFISCKSSHLSMIETSLLDDVGFVGGTLGGFIFTEFGNASDALFAGVKVLEMLARLDRPMSTLIDTIQFPKVVHKNIACSWDQKGKVMGRLMEETRNMNRELLHGIKIYGDDYWVLFMPVVEHALFKISAESSSETKSKKLVEEWGAKLRTFREE